MIEPSNERSSTPLEIDENRLLRPVPMWWSRLAGAVLLVAAAGLTAVIAWLVVLSVRNPVAVPFTSSTLIFLLILLVAWAFCAQAGWRLLRGPVGGPGSLVSWVVWLALGVLLLTLAALMTVSVFAEGPPTGHQLYVLLVIGTLGAWCLRFAWRGRGR